MPAALILLAALTASPANAADVNTGFADGNGTSTPDQFIGTIGDGWLTEWAGTGSSSSVIATSPIDDGNYLSSIRAATGNATLRRQFDLGAGEMVSGLPYDVEWTWRFDGDITQMTTFDDRIHFFADSGAVSGSANTNSWLIGVSSTLNGSSGFNGGNFYFYNNTGSAPGGFGETDMIDTGIALDSTTAGDVFTFKIIVDPGRGRYDATIMNTTTGSTYTAANLKFRNATTNASTTSYLHFGSNANSATDNTTFSLDSIGLTAHHQIVARFDDLNVPNKIDTFNSAAAGGGWAGEWGTAGTGISATVVAADPLNGPDDPYLQVSLVNTSTTSQDYEIRREFEDFGRIDINGQHKVSWKWRFDGDLADFNDSGEDRIHFFADNDASAGTNDSNAWLIGVTSERSGFVDGDFYFFDGSDSNTFSGANTVQTGITLQEDVVYSFDVWVDPDTKSYSARITDEFGNSFFASGMKFRNYLTANMPDMTWNRLHFGASANGLDDDLSFSLDSVVISQVPEPSTIALAVLGLVLWGIVGWRRRNHR